MGMGTTLALIAWFCFALAFGIAGAKRCSPSLWVASICFSLAFVLRLLLAVYIVNDGDWWRFTIFVVAGIGIVPLLLRLRVKNGIG